MSQKLEASKLLYTQISESEKAELKAFIKDFDESLHKRSISENLNEAFNKSLVPKMSTGCPLCGK